MNFLQLVNRAISESGSSLTPLTTLANPAAGEATRFINWVQDAWNEIQVMQSQWNFARPWIHFATVNQQQQYSLAYLIANGVNEVTGAALTGLTIKEHVRKSFRCWRTSQGTNDEQIVNFMDWDEFRNIYVYATQRTNYARPVIGTIAPDKAIWFGPIPDQATGPGDSYTISLEVWLAPQVLSVDADVPLMPTQYHMLVVWKALEYYAGFESAPEVLMRAQAGWRSLYPKLCQDQLPILHMGPPLATDTRG